MTCDYTILGVRQTTTLGPLGGYVNAQEITFSMPGAAMQKITLPTSEATEANVKAAIEARCTQIGSILNLGK